jgi:hypothetical protein
MPHLVQLDKRYKKKGLSLITVECQNSPKDAIDGALKKARAEFPVTRGTTRPPTMQGIPHAAVFDAKGKLVFAGHPSDDDFERSIKKALKGVDADSGSSSDADPSDATESKPVIESREWTNSDGRKITAAVVSIDGDKVKFKLSNGKEVPYAIAKLSEEDQELIKKSGEETADEE